MSTLSDAEIQRIIDALVCGFPCADTEIRAALALKQLMQERAELIKNVSK